jgi:hypothetical protein
MIPIKIMRYKMNFKHIKGRIKFVSPIAYFSNAMSVLLLSAMVIILGMFGVESTVPMMVASVCVLSIALQTYFFKVNGVQESGWVDKEWLQKEHKLTLDQLNQYSRFNYKVYTFIKAFVGLMVLIAPAHVEEEVNVFSFALILVSFIVRKWLGKNGAIPFPAGFFKGSNNYRYKKMGWSELDTSNQLGSGISSYKWKDM